MKHHNSGSDRKEIVKRERMKHLLRIGFEKSIVLSDCMINGNVAQAESVLKELKDIVEIAKHVQGSE